MTIGPRPICFECKHLRPEDPAKESFQCDAFPEGIPDEFIESIIQHDRPYPGDHGIQFEEGPRE